jgi:hypothetical protein
LADFSSEIQTTAFWLLQVEEGKDWRSENHERKHFDKVDVSDVIDAVVRDN